MHLAGIENHHPGSLQSASQFLVLTVIVWTIAADAIERIFAKCPAAVIKATGFVLLQTVAVFQ